MLNLRSYNSSRYSRLWPYIRRQKRSLVLIVAITAVLPMLAALLPLPTKILIDRAFVGMAGLEEAARDNTLDALLAHLPLPTSSAGLVAAAAGLSLGVFLVSAILESLLTYLWSIAGQRMVMDMAADMFHRLQRLTPAFHVRNSVGDLLSRITGDAWCVYTVTETLHVAPVQNALTLIVVGLLAWQFDWAMTLIVLAVAPAIAATVVYFGPRLKQRMRASRQNQSQLFSFVHQTLSAVPLVQTFGAQQRHQEHFTQLASSAVALSQRNSVLKNSYALATGLLTTSGIAIVLYVGAHRVMSGAMTVGSLVVFLAYLRTLQSAVTGLLRIHGTLKEAEASIDRVIEILDSDEQVKESASARDLVRDAGGVSVRFDEITFGYDNDRPVLQSVTLDIAAGSTVALVGPTGAGKSTLASLVPRLVDPWSGRVLLAGQDVRELMISSVRDAVAVVPQEPLLLPLSIRENIAFGRPDATIEQIKSAAEASAAVEFIERLPQGYETVIGERGATLSAGQRQRIAIARALLREASVLVLDEPTSALDASSEAHVVRGLAERSKGKLTVLVIAHRLSTVREADLVAVLKDGRIVEQGTPAELTLRGSIWAPPEGSSSSLRRAATPEVAL